MKYLRRILSGIGITLLVIIIATVGWLTYLIRSPIPQISGNTKLANLKNSVNVYRDQWAIPQIYAENTHDLFLAQGYVHAQDRFFQMEFTRRLLSGKLAEWFGPDVFDVDRYMKTLGLARVVEQEYKALDPNTKAALDAYAEGVNAYIDSQTNFDFAFNFLIVQGIQYAPEHWTSLDTLLWVKGMALNLDGNMYNELSRVALIQKVGIDRMQEIRPTYPNNRPVIVSTSIDYKNLALGHVAANVNALRSLSNGQGSGLGSNSWAIAGNLTSTGKPYLADDPHLGIQIPSIWYEIGLHCVKVTKECPYDVVGVSFPGVPGVLIGHNQRIAWGFTNLKADVQDLYVERINPQNATQYEVNGKWVDMEVAHETINVHGEFQSSAPDASSFKTSYDAATGSSKVTFPVYKTRHGPIIDPVSEPVRGLSGSFGAVSMPAKHAVSLRWVALEPTQTMQAILELDRAQNFDDFRAALSHFDDPTQNIIYADIDGNIGYQTPGKIPVRAQGDGLLPVPGWTDEYEWQGYIPHEKLPFAYNPPKGYVVAANNAIVGPEYPYLISLEWDPGTRAQRIVDLIDTQKDQPITREYITQMQNDTFDIAAQEMVEQLKSLQFDDNDTQKALNTLLTWDFKTGKDSSPAALYSIFIVELTKITFGDELTPDTWPDIEAVNRLMKDKNNLWWDDVATKNAVETRDDVLHKAFLAAYADAKKVLGPDPAAWQWGKLHTGMFRQSPLGTFGIPIVDPMFNRGPYPFSGSAATINSTYWVWHSEMVDAAAPEIYETLSFPAMRMIVDLNNFQESLMVNAGGASGHPFDPHYDDMIDLWLNGKYHPLLWNRTQIETTSSNHLLLTP